MIKSAGFKKLIVNGIYFVIVFFIFYNLFGFFEYVNKTSVFQDNRIIAENIDAVVVLTGGAGRLDAAYRFLQEGKTKLLLISGVDPSVGLDDIFSEYSWDNKFKPFVMIDKGSATTFENAKYVSDFVLKHKIKKMLLVTSLYHINRANFLFEKILEGRNIDIIAYAVYKDPIDLNSWWTDFSLLKNLLWEYIKYRYYYIVLSSL